MHVTITFIDLWKDCKNPSRAPNILGFNTVKISGTMTGSKSPWVIKEGCIIPTCCPNQEASDMWIMISHRKPQWLRGPCGGPAKPSQRDALDLQGRWGVAQQKGLCSSFSENWPSAGSQAHSRWTDRSQALIQERELSRDPKFLENSLAVKIR